MNRAAVDADLSEAIRLRAIGQDAAAADAVERVLALVPKDPRARNMRGAMRLAARDFIGAEDDFAAAADIDPAPPILLNLALARNGRGDAAGEREALDRALTADPYFQLALFHSGRWLMRNVDARAAAAAFGRFLSTIAPGAELTPALAAAVAEAEPVVRAEAARLGDQIDQAFVQPPTARVAAAANIYAGRVPIYRSQPVNLYVPYLPEVPFFSRDQFPWFAQLEGMADAITRELTEVIASDAGMEPYIAFESTLPLNQWRDLNNSRAWSAFHLWRHGVADVDNQQRCPQTSRLIAALPLFDLVGRGPNVMFSILSPGAHIPPHTGSSNARATVHLPLVVPPGCTFRVGPEIREWRVGEAFGFDDTIEHEAWNRGDAPRAVLIVDAWNPNLSAADRADVGTLTTAIDRYSGRTDWSV